MVRTEKDMYFWNIKYIFWTTGYDLPLSNFQQYLFSHMLKISVLSDKKIITHLLCLVSDSWIIQKSLKELYGTFSVNVFPHRLWTQLFENWQSVYLLARTAYSQALPGNREFPAFFFIVMAHLGFDDWMGSILIHASAFGFIQILRYRNHT